MILLYIAIVLLSVIGIGWRREGDSGQCLSIQQCNAIKGISILLVFISHACDYVTICGYSYDLIGDNLFLAINRGIGQFCVVMFLFYSGYGTELSILNKGDDYVKRIPRRRCLTTLLNFDVAVIVFLVIRLLLGKDVVLSQFFISLTAWDSIGNSNWYIFVIIACYFISFVAATITSNHRKSFVVMLALTLTLIGVLYFFKTKEMWWYDTILAYPAGAFVALNKDRFMKSVTKNYKSALLGTMVLLGAVVSLAIFVLNGRFHAMTYNLASVLFAFLVLMITMRIKVQNAVLIWLGTNLFPLYIYQRAPMMVMANSCPSFVASYPLGFCVVSLAITILIALAYRYVKISID